MRQSDGRRPRRRRKACRQSLPSRTMTASYSPQDSENQAHLARIEATNVPGGLPGTRRGRLLTKPNFGLHKAQIYVQSVCDLQAAASSSDKGAQIADGGHGAASTPCETYPGTGCYHEEYMSQHSVDSWGLPSNLSSLSATQPTSSGLTLATVTVDSRHGL